RSRLDVRVGAPWLRGGDGRVVCGRRQAGASQASTRQGILFLRHLAALLVYVPSGARPLKFAMVTLAGLAVFAGLLYGLAHTGVQPMLAWLTGTAASAACTLALLQLAPFRELGRHGEPDGNRLFYVAAGVSAVT